MTTSAYDRKGRRTATYDVVALGAKANMTDLAAAIGLGELATFHNNQSRRARLAQRYNSNLSEYPDLLSVPACASRATHAWHLYIIRFNLSALRPDRDAIRRSMAEHGIECGVHYRPLFETSLFAGMGLKAGDYPNAAAAGQSVLTLPLYPTLKSTQVDYICDCLSSVLLKSKR